MVYLEEDLIRIKCWYTRWGTWCGLSVWHTRWERKISSLFWGTSLWANCILIVEDQLSKVRVELKVFWLRFLWLPWVSVIAYIDSGNSSSSSSSGIKVCGGHIFYGVGLSAPCPTPNLEVRSIPFSQAITFDLSGKGGPTSSYATASIAFKIIWPHQPRHYVTVAVPFGVSVVCLFLAQQPPVGQGLLIDEVSRSHTTTHYSR